jgi:hypothetical protein
MCISSWTPTQGRWNSVHCRAFHASILEGIHYLFGMDFIFHNHNGGISRNSLWIIKSQWLEYWAASTQVTNVSLQINFYLLNEFLILLSAHIYMGIVTFILLSCQHNMWYSHTWSRHRSNGWEDLRIHGINMCTVKPPCTESQRTKCFVFCIMIVNTYILTPRVLHGQTHFFISKRSLLQQWLWKNAYIEDLSFNNSLRDLQFLCHVVYWHYTETEWLWTQFILM